VSERVGFDRIIGQELPKAVLRRAVRQKTPAHTYLFLGPAGAGKTTTAIEFAKALNCEKPLDGDACGVCARCQAIARGNATDVRVWEPEGKNTKIDQMREMRDHSNFRPLKGPWKINIVEQGDTLNEDSANCILKLLEEPPDYLVNILLYRNGAAVLPTIRSRAQLVRFNQANSGELASRLVEDFGLDEDRAQFMATFSQGCPGAAIRLLQDSEFFDRRDAVIACAGALGNPWPALRLAEVIRASGASAEAEPEPRDDEEPAPEDPEPAKTARKSVSREAVLESLDTLALWYRDLLALLLRGDEAALINIDKRDEILAQCRLHPSPESVAAGLERILATKRYVIGNANAAIATDALMVRLATLARPV